MARFRQPAPTDARIKPGNIGYIHDIGGGIPALTWDFPALDDEASLAGHFCVFYVNNVPAGVPTHASHRQCAFPDSPQPSPGKHIVIRCYGELGDEYSDSYQIPGEPLTPTGLKLLLRGKEPFGMSWVSPASADMEIWAVNGSGRILSTPEPANERSLHFSTAIYAGERIYLVARDRTTNEKAESKEFLNIEQFAVDPPVGEGDLADVKSSERWAQTLTWSGPKIEASGSGHGTSGHLMDISRVHSFADYTECTDVGDGSYSIPIRGTLPGVPFRLVLLAHPQGFKIGSSKVFYA